MNLNTYHLDCCCYCWRIVCYCNSDSRHGDVCFGYLNGFSIWSSYDGEVSSFENDACDCSYVIDFGNVNLWNETSWLVQVAFIHWSNSTHMIGCCDCGYANAIWKPAVPVVFPLHQLAQHAGSFLFIWMNVCYSMDPGKECIHFEGRIEFLPNLSRTDGPGGGGCDGIGLLVSYLDVGYETGGCDEDAL